MKAVLYARFSTDLQSDRSIPDQLRTCEQMTVQHGFTVAGRFSDAAISGGTTRRPGYQNMMEAARRRDFDVIVAEGCSRLWRNMAEQAPRLAELTDLGIHVVTRDLDTRQESAGILAAVLGASSEAYRREIARRTRQGLEGLARDGKPTGGRAYGYDGLSVCDVQADIVREIFARFAQGETQRAIAADLNRRGVPSPGATWNRTERASDGKWRVSAIHTLLHNERYIGRVIWNRCRWVRSASDSARRTRVENPRDDWIVHDRQELTIVDLLTWKRCQARSNTGFSSPKARPKYLLSGLLECGVCGSKMTITGGRGHRYICGNRHTGPGCANDLGVSRKLAERLILLPVRETLLAPEAVRHAVKYLRGMEAPAPRPDPRIADLKRMILDGTLSAKEAAPAIERLHASVPPRQEPEIFLVAAAYEEMATELHDSLEAGDVAAARPLLREIIGPITALPTEADGQRFLTAHFQEQSMALAVGAMVAGAGFVCGFQPIQLRRGGAA